MLRMKPLRNICLMKTQGLFWSIEIEINQIKKTLTEDL